jgi:hypothetical protein
VLDQRVVDYGNKIGDRHLVQGPWLRVDAASGSSG